MLEAPREVIERALRLSAQQTDAVQSARTRARCLVRRIWVSGWNDRDAEDFHSALAEIRRDDDPEVVADDLIDYGYIQWGLAQYREAYRNVIEGLESSPAGRIRIRISARHTSAASWSCRSLSCFWASGGKRCAKSTPQSALRKRMPTISVHTRFESIVPGSICMPWTSWGPSDR